MKIEVIVSETTGIERCDEPVTFGLPVSMGTVFDTACIRLLSAGGVPVACGLTILSRWADGSVKWLLIDAQVSVPPRDQVTLTLDLAAGAMPGPEAFPSVKAAVSGDDIVIHTGAAVFELSPLSIWPFSQIRTGSNTGLLSDGGSRLLLTDGTGHQLQPLVDSWNIEHDTDLKKTLFFKGHFRHPERGSAIAFESRIRFAAGKPHAAIDITLHNSDAALHPGGLWDLGDRSSFFFKDLSLEFEADVDDSSVLFHAVHPGDRLSEDRLETPFMIYQDSSGLDNWKSACHVNRNGDVPLSFKGYKVYRGGECLRQGEQALPVVGVGGERNVLSVYIEKFWQNFPKAVTYEKGVIRLGLFPGCFNDWHELQPGEKKTHTIHVGASGRQETETMYAWATAPLVPVVSSHYYRETLVAPTPVRGDENDGVYRIYETIQEIAVKGEHSFFRKRELIDQFGWRHFGDVYADHEAVFSENPGTFVSHYNNQYDVIKGAVLQFLGTGNHNWSVLAREMADHVADIDIYHTKKDKYQFNGGMFWHTDHHLDAGTATHRTFSRQSLGRKKAGTYGGGPAPDHNYATGFLYLYFLTGEARYRQAVISLAGNIINLLNGPDTLSEMAFDSLRRLKGKLASRGGVSNDKVYVFDGPGRASGNALNTLLDAWELTSDSNYLFYAESVIFRCVSTTDDFTSMNLLNAELRWMYTIFILALGRYLDLKQAAGDLDTAFHRAREILLYYASWMAENEYPYLDKPDILEFPTETWAAQDMRKADVFAYAACHEEHEDKQQLFIRKSRFFFDSSVTSLGKFESHWFTRPVVLMLTNGMKHLSVRYGVKPGKRKEQEKTVNTSGLPLKSFRNRPFRFSLKKEMNWLSLQLRSRL